MSKNFKTLMSTIKCTEAICKEEGLHKVSKDEIEFDIGGGTMLAYVCHNSLEIDINKGGTKTQVRISKEHCAHLKEWLDLNF